ncbi:MAG: hypothetical protein KA354_15060 [Phycisphaerae bacterium]|nr:hypothetical protein [Phycisphaerae bacterium]
MSVPRAADAVADFVHDEDIEIVHRQGGGISAGDLRQGGSYPGTSRVGLGHISGGDGLDPHGFVAGVFHDGQNEAHVAVFEDLAGDPGRGITESQYAELVNHESLSACAQAMASILMMPLS